MYCQLMFCFVCIQCMKCGERFDETEVQMKIKSTLGATDVPYGFTKGSAYFSDLYLHFGNGYVC